MIPKQEKYKMQDKDFRVYLAINKHRRKRQKMAVKVTNPPTNSSRVPKVATKPERKYVAIGKESGIMPKLLFQLLSFSGPYKKETVTQNIVINQILKAASVSKKNETSKITKPTKDGAGNIYTLVTSDTVPSPNTLFSSHMDTVHDDETAIELYMCTQPDTDKGNVIGVVNGSRSILGADDKLGVYIMLEMIHNRVPGLYIFHVGEESGGIGSKHILKHNEELIKGYSRAIAFDRKGYFDIIRRQRGGTCCSDDFVNALAKELTEARKKLPDPIEPKFGFSGASGTFTDTATYMSVIPECTNLSVGYFNQHTSREEFDLPWLINTFLPMCLHVDWESLPTKRDPSIKTTTTYSGGGYYNNPAWDNWNGYDYYGGGASGSNHMRSNSNNLGIPAYLEDVDDKWHPLDGVPVGSTSQEFYKLVRRWSYHSRDIIIANTRNAVIENDRLATDYQRLMGTLIDVYEDLENMVAWATQRKDDTIEQTEIAVLISDITGTIQDAIEKSPAAPKKEDNNVVALPPNNRTDDIVAIEFDHETLTAKQNGKELTLFGKKGKPIHKRHTKHLQKGTKLFVKVDNIKRHIHTITRKEPFFKKEAS